MPLYLDTIGRPHLAIAYCDRCSRKFPIDELSSDPNSPGLMVCAADRDDFDPYRMPQRPADVINLPFVRSDTSIATDPNGVISEDGNMFLITEDGDEFLVFDGTG